MNLTCLLNLIRASAVLSTAWLLAACRPTPPPVVTLEPGQWQAVEGGSALVGSGAGVFDPGPGPGQVYVLLEADMPIAHGLTCLFCAEVIHLGEGVRVPVSFFADVPLPPDVPPDAPLLAVSFDRPFDIPLDETRFLVGGPGGADLQKVENGFVLLAGSAYLEYITTRDS